RPARDVVFQGATPARDFATDVPPPGEGASASTPGGREGSGPHACGPAPSSSCVVLPSPRASCPPRAPGRCRSRFGIDAPPRLSLCGRAMQHIRLIAPSVALLAALIGCGARTSLPGPEAGGGGTGGGPPCVEGQTRACGSNVGACKQGTETCHHGAFGP